ncbi:ATP-binding protein [Spirillospora sp. NPDC050679]
MSAPVCAPVRAQTTLPGRPRTVADARRFAAQALAQVPGLPAGTCDDAVTCVSELATNAVRHTAGRPYQVSVEADLAHDPGRVRVEVADGGHQDDHEYAPGQASGCVSGRVPEVLLGGAESGRGLWICASLGVLTCSRTARGGWRVAVTLPHPNGSGPAPVP